MSPKTPERLPDHLPEDLPPEDPARPEGEAPAETPRGSGKVGRLAQLTAAMALGLTTQVSAQTPADGPDRGPPKADAKKAEAMPPAASMQYMNDLQGALTRANVAKTPEAAVAETLNVGTAAEWRKTLEIIGADPPTLKEANRPPLLQSELEGRFQSLKRNQAIMKRYVLDVFSYTKNGRRPEADVREIYLRSFARYLDAFETYELYAIGKSSVNIPPYLKEFLKLKPEENAALKAAERFLPLQYDVARSKGLTKTPRDLAPVSGAILSAAMRKSVTVGQLLTTPPEQLLPVIGYRDELLTDDAVQSLKLLVGYVEKYQKHLVENVSKLAERPGRSPEETVQNMPLAEAMIYLHDPFVGEFAEEATNYLRDRKMPDLVRIMDRLSEKNVGFAKQQVELVFVPLAEGTGRKIETIDERNAFRKDTAQITEFVKTDGERVTLNTLELGIVRLDATAQPLLLKMRERLMSAETTEILLKSCLLPAENAEDRDLRDMVRKDLEELIGNGGKGGPLKLRDAFELYVLTSTQSNPLLRAAKITQILKKNNKPSAGKLQAHLVVILQEAALNRGGLPDSHLSEDQQRELNNVGEFLADAGIEKANETVQEIKDLIEAEGRKYPHLKAILYALLGLGVGYSAYLAYLRRDRTKLVQFANMGGKDLDAFVEKHKLTEDEIRTVRQIQAEMKKILAKQAADKQNTAYTLDVRGIRRNWNTRFGVYRSDLRALRGAALSKDLGDFAKALRSRYGVAELDEAARILANCTDDMDAVTKALIDAEYPADRVGPVMARIRREKLLEARAHDDLIRAEEEARAAEERRVSGTPDTGSGPAIGPGPAPSGRIGGGGTGPRTGDSGARTGSTGGLGGTGRTETQANPDNRTDPNSDPNIKKK